MIVEDWFRNEKRLNISNSKSHITLKQRKKTHKQKKINISN